MKKRLFKVLNEMNQADEKNGTRNLSVSNTFLSVSNTFISVDKVKQDAKVCMGVDEQVLMDILNGKVIPILIVVNKDEYFKNK